MSIKDIAQKIKSQCGDMALSLRDKVKKSLDINEDLFIIFSIILIGLTGFGLGKLSSLEKGRESVKITSAQVHPSSDGLISFTPVTTTTNLVDVSLNSGNKNGVPMSAAAIIASESAKGMLVASKNGTKYHFPWCAGASQIAEKNKIWFDSYEKAKKAGYTPAVNCKGLE